ncbi:RNA polymerase sigma factor [Humisphaera borealis]|uniref:RNA polymerase sigma factor n=1 Tax=Humisphaera borealis TaxID=2807512 RepID=A0A7M2X1G0_9BACT|nr:RNA polymerase sigma factor [Humisphaera borealis]QOV91292.1 RNA polymerase sigma factor [Humisphaera borealis]
MSDVEQSTKPRSGAPADLQDLVLKHARELYGLAYSLTGNSADAEDVVQQALVGALRGIGSYEGRSSLKTWLYTIVINQASKTRRSLRLRKASPLEAGEIADSAARGSGKGATHNGNSIATVDFQIDVATMLDALSHEHREVMVLREMHQMSYEEIAEALAIPRGTVESRLFRARRFLREKFPAYVS